MWRLGLLTFIALASAFLQPARSVGQRGQTDQEHENDVPVLGSYFNAKYGYSVVVPDGFTAYRMKGPAPQHGIAIYGTPNSRDEIWINGEYDAAGEGSAEAVAKSTVDDFSRYQLKDISISGRTLSGLDAADVVLRSTMSTPGRVSYIHMVVAYRPRRSGVPIVYTIGVRTAAIGSPLVGNFSKLVRSFRIEALAE